ncbi:glycosyltransferase family 2 protein [Sinomonas atrocyanea]|uniref:glycosyltransferase family 2 protein n=1 Tax=Sinomonas atrocyanea TaxID=37927 RepID=UPI002783EBDF|nr:glycosyltransferase family 2 protein [Sinomonas atrocyanea]MDQ0261890.1 dolichol-phosphate mannosyltransferase [Sinomonas atrocyanea]MDR6623642.1 dolichol-phosphate mannosyltransferase [Sinomonas atrocyanea]
MAKTGTALFMPAWNEAENLPLVVHQAVTYLRERDEPFTVIVVDDGSTDHSHQVLETLKREYSDCFLYVRHASNEGYGSALRTGFHEGLKTGHDWIGFCDADGQFMPADIGKLKDSAVASGSDIAIGYRLARADRLQRRIMGKAWSVLSSALLGHEAIDVDCGLKIFHRDALLQLAPLLTGQHATISPEILILARQAGQKIVQVGVPHYLRRHGTASGAAPHVVWESLKGLVHVRQALRKGA